ncbi:Glycerol kinase [Stieleria maiorica]|uniref:Glycerol kinase n=1 Tax=Stieleria maiorica TaxID=2795974 RepID=A0A5B9MC89_9BACT|nr:glycerol kinase GlpK [Stieleria maiorica]QEF98383.1 Glycerol kinase [Stieleria maiorica]
MSVVLAFDQGTTSSRAIAFEQSGAVLGVAQREFKQHYPQPGWVEHDADEIWQSQLAVAQEVIASCGLSVADIAAIGITNQRETTLLWDRSTGEPIHHAIVWQDRRTSQFCDSLRSDGHGELVQSKTGLLIDPYFSATKIRWLLDHVPDARRRAEAGEIAFGTMDSWLIWKLTGGRVHVTDVTNASRTMLLDIRTGRWDDELLSLLEIPASILPDVQPSSHVYGETETQWFGGAIKIAGAAGDQQSALFGQNCTRHGMAKNTYGTGCFMLMNIGEQPLMSKHQLLTSIAATAASGDGPPKRNYALEGSVFVAGAAVQWLRDGLGIIESSSEIEALAKSVPDSDGVYVVPAMAGLGAPHWDSYARGTIVGLTRGSNRGHIARATLEGIAHQVADVLDVMQQDSGIAIKELRVDGGASANDLLMQFQADIMKTPVVRPEMTETTSMGAAYLAGLAVGFWKDLDQIASIWKTERVFHPEMSDAEVALRRERWSEALQRSRSWEQGAT